MARKVNTKELNNPTPVIIGAGITEECYFKHLKNLLNLRVSIRPGNFGCEDFSYLEERIDLVLKQETVAICVFDVDTVENNSANKAKFEKLKGKYSDREDVLLCDSLPSIEYWFLIHYEDTNRYFSNSKDVIKALGQYVSNYGKTKKFLENKKWVVDMIADNRLDDAIGRAKKYSAGEGSYTNIYKAIEKIMGTK